jgi:hypothetical protein
VGIRQEQTTPLAGQRQDHRRDVRGELFQHSDFRARAAVRPGRRQRSGRSSGTASASSLQLGGIDQAALREVDQHLSVALAGLPLQAAGRPADRMPVAGGPASGAIRRRREAPIRAGLRSQSSDRALIDASRRCIGEPIFRRRGGMVPRKSEPCLFSVRSDENVELRLCCNGGSPGRDQ